MEKKVALVNGWLIKKQLMPCKIFVLFF